MPTARPTTEEATEAWSEQIVRQKEVYNLAFIHLLEELTKGEPVSRERASEVLGVSGEKIGKMFMGIDAAGGQFDDQGNFIGMALTLKPTRHSFRVNGNDMYAWCSLDTIALPGILEAEGEIESNDPVTGKTIRLTVTADQVVKVEPAGAVTSISFRERPRARPKTAKWSGVPSRRCAPRCSSMSHGRAPSRRLRTIPTLRSSPLRKPST